MARKKPVKAEPKNNLFKPIEYNVIEECSIGDTKLRLVNPVGYERRFIQLWSTLSKQWNLIYRYDVDENWIKWKNIHARILARKHEDKKALGRKSDVGQTPAKAKRKPRAKATPVKPKNGVGSRRRKVKD